MDDMLPTVLALLIERGPGLREAGVLELSWGQLRVTFAPHVPTGDAVSAEPEPDDTPRFRTRRGE